MADENATYPPSETGGEDWPGPEGDEGERAAPQPARLLGVLLLFVTLIVLLLLLQDCGGSGISDSGDDKRQIEEVENAEPVDGLVSLWVEPGVDVEFVIAKSGVKSQGSTDLGESRYVIEVVPGSESRSVEALQSVRGVYDAGLVYAEEGSESTVTP